MELVAELRKPILRAWLSETEETAALIGAAALVVATLMYQIGQ